MYTSFTFTFTFLWFVHGNFGGSIFRRVLWLNDASYSTLLVGIFT